MLPRKSPGLILDLDGTLYRLRSPDGTFDRSDFNVALQRRAVAFIGRHLQVTPRAAQRIFAEARQHGNVSMALEQRYSIDRYDWFADVWNLDPADFIAPAAADLADRLRQFAGQCVVLTAGPRIWATAALRYLGIAEVLGGRLITGEPDIRKPDLAVFRQAARLLARRPDSLVSIGDQHHTDIAPARQLGMRTIIIGPHQADATYRADDIDGALDIVERMEQA